MPGFLPGRCRAFSLVVPIMPQQSCRLYLITPPAIADLDQFTDIFRASLEAAAGTAAEVACVQLRLKGAADEEILAATERLLPVAQKYDAAFLINDRPDLARKARADGVHIGQGDMPYAEARAMLGEDAAIGVTCHASTHLAMEAGEAGADYVAFGAFYPTATKEVTHKAAPEVLAFWSHATTVPCVAIGGITPENASPIVAAGADFLAVSGSVWSAPDSPVAAIGRFAEVLSA